MLKRILSTLTAMMALTVMVNAQCTPDLMCPALICPDTATNLPHATALSAYSTTMTVIVPADTTINPYGTISVDSLVFGSITGLPTGFTAVADQTKWPGGTSGCVLISGTTGTNQIGTHPLTINTTAYAMFGLISLPLVLTGYKVVVDSANGIASIDINKFAVEQNMPNPFSGNTSISFTSPNPGKYSFTVCNLIGELVYSRTVNANTGINKFDFSGAGLPSGMYMYKLSNGNTTVTKRMIIEKN